MSHRVPFISPTSVVTAAVILVLAALLALSLSSPGAAHAEVNRQAALDQETLESRGDIGFPVSTQDPDAGHKFSATNHDLPEVSIYAVMPEVGEEGRSVTVTLKLSRPLRTDEKYCYPGRESDGNDGSICIEGGIIVWDTYNDHLREDGATTSDELVKFVFRGGEVEKRLTVRIADDECITPGRTVRIAINWAFRSDTYGYTIDDTQVTVPVNGNDESDDTDLWDDYDSETGQGKCKPVDEGATEEFIYNHAPLFDGQPPTFTVPENTAANQDIGGPVTATDSDVGDTLTYSLDGTDASSFAIDSTTGQIKTRQGVTYDHETKDTYHVAVFVRDSKNIYGDSDTVDDDSIDVTINVTDVNEPPAFDSTAPTALNIVENTIAGVDIGSPVTATDPDDGDTLTYSLDTGDGSAFDIDSSGQIKTKGALDRETKDSYTVTVTASDDGGANATHDVTITVDNEVEPPTFNDGDAGTTRTIAENTPAGRPVGDPVSTTSEDGVTLTYSLDDQDGASFDIDSNGQIKTKADLDHEDRSLILCHRIGYRRPLDANGNTEGTPTEDASIDFTINVTDVNEKPQFADDAPTTQNVDENTPAGMNIGSAYTATDPDAGDTLTYSLDDGDGAAFDIDSSGQIKTKADLNYEADPSYTVIVQVTDSRDDSGTTEQTPVADDTITVTITIDNEVEPPTFNEEPPQGQNSLARSVAENTPAGRPIGNPVSATSEDGATLTYSLDDQDGASFEIDSNGQIKTKDALDYEDTQNIYSVTVSVTDGKDVHGSAESPAVEDDSIDVTINVTDVNEKPQFAEETAEITIPEDTEVGQTVGDALSATDPDTGDTVSYSVRGPDAALFQVDSNGQLQVKEALDFEDKSSLTVVVSATDSRDDAGDPDTADDATITVTIIVTDEDDPGAIALSSQEPSAGTELIATLDDDDGTPTDVVWKWETSTDEITWTVIDGATTNSYIPQTGDVGDYLRVTATYTDGLGPNKTAQATPTSAVLPTAPTNGLPAFADDAPTTLNVLENTPAGENIGDPFTATDTDTGDTLTYALDDQDGASFEIDSSGQIKTKSALDHETKDTYSVTVSVHDGNDPFGNPNAAADDTIDVTIDVTNMEVPAIPEEPTVEATPGAAAGLTITWPAIEPTDDSPVDGYDVQYRVKGTTDTAPWLTANVTVTGASATITGLVYSTTYEVQAQARNSEGPSGWSPTGEGTIPARLDVTLSPARTLTVNEGSSATFTVTVSPAADRALSIPVSASSDIATIRIRRLLSERHSPNL